MSAEENTRLAQSAYQAFGRGDVATLAEMMKMHLSTTTDELMSRLNKKWDDDVKAFDNVYDHILKMSDALSDGIVKQYPDRF